MPRLAAMNAEQRKELNRDKRRANAVRHDAEMHEYEVTKATTAWRLYSETGKACAAAHAEWQKAVSACTTTIGAKEIELLTKAIHAAKEAAEARVKLEVCERTGKTELVTAPAGHSWERNPKPETRETLEEIRTKHAETERKASEAMEAVCTLEARREAARVELARLKAAEPSLVPTDDGSAQYAVYADAIEKRVKLGSQLKELECAIDAKRTGFRESNTVAAAGGDAKRSKVDEEEDGEENEEEDDE